MGPHATTTRRPRRPGARRRERQAPNEDDDFEDDDQELGIGDDQSLNDRSSLSRAFLKFVKNVKEMSGELASSWRSVKELTVVSKFWLLVSGVQSFCLFRIAVKCIARSGHAKSRT